MTAPTTFEIGTTLGGMLALSALTVPVPEPESSFSNYAETVKLGSGLVRGLGYPLAEWHYGFLKETQFDQLLTFCTTASAAVFIATRTNGNSFLRYTANMIVPETYIIRNGRYVDIVFNFNSLIAAE